MALKQFHLKASSFGAHCDHKTEFLSLPPFLCPRLKKAICKMFIPFYYYRKKSGRAVSGAEKDLNLALIGYCVRGYLLESLELSDLGFVQFIV